MISDLLWTLIAIQIAMGAFDTLYHHELTERLAWRPSQRRELQLHAVRDWLYAVLFAVLAWIEPYGVYAVLVAIVLLVEVVITLIDFVEEDLTRRLPASERINHTLLALNYGAILALLAPVLLNWSYERTALIPTYYGAWTWLLSGTAMGTMLFGFRDFAAARRSERLYALPAAGLIPVVGAKRSILVTGATGFVGQRLVEALVAEGHGVIALVRNASKRHLLPTPVTLITSLDAIEKTMQIDAIVNLAGEPIADSWWTKGKQRRIVDSRRDVTGGLIDLMARLEKRPEVLVSGSAIGWYGLWDDDELDETCQHHPCFSHDVCQSWETDAKRAEALGVRVVLLRIGLVLGLEGGILARMLTPFEFCFGGTLGDGKQWMSWISRDDLVRLIGHAISTEDLAGCVNATAPAPVTNATFTKALAEALGRPAWTRLPASMLRLLGGNMARELLLGGQRVVPKRAIASGFSFRHTTFRNTLSALLEGNTTAI